MKKKSVAVLGSTGSVGRQIVDILSHYRDFYSVDVVTAHSNYELLSRQARELCVKSVIIHNKDYHLKLKYLLSDVNINVACYEAGTLDFLESLDMIFIASSGVMALEPLLFALHRNIEVAIANKESLVCGGELLSPYIKNIFPLDSEHFSVWRLLNAVDKSNIKKIILTATGGPFFQKDASNASIADAINHPVWEMGEKISIDSATMMNKVLEVVEAHYLFDIPKKDIEILIHPQAIVHGLLRLNDGAEHALLFNPDMRAGINYVLADKIRIQPRVMPSSFSLAGRNLSFFSADSAEFPSLEFLKTDQHIILSAVNEIAALAFLRGDICFQGIVRTISFVLDKYSYRIEDIKSFEDVVETHRRAEDIATSCIKNPQLFFKSAAIMN